MIHLFLGLDQEIHFNPIHTDEVSHMKHKATIIRNKNKLYFRLLNTAGIE